MIALVLTLMITAWLGTGPALGAALYIDPNKGQSPEQQSRDRYDCHLRAVQQTGIDPIRGGQCPQFPLAGLDFAVARHMTMRNIINSNTYRYPLALYRYMKRYLTH
jgi:hypothetical protein